MSRILCIAAAALLSAVMAGPAGAQGRGGIPVPPLPDQPWEYQTANARIRVRVLTAGLENPWSLEFLPDASILITERNGRLRHFKDGVLSGPVLRSEEHTSELQSQSNLVCRLLLENHSDHRALHSFPTRRSSDLPLPDQPWEYQTANARIRVRVLTAGLENPWSLEFLPDASILITERNGRLRHFKDGVLSGPVL